MGQSPTNKTNPSMSCSYMTKHSINTFEKLWAGHKVATVIYQRYSILQILYEGRSKLMLLLIPHHTTATINTYLSCHCCPHKHQNKRTRPSLQRERAQNNYWPSTVWRNCFHMTGKWRVSEGCHLNKALILPDQLHEVFLLILYQ